MQEKTMVADTLAGINGELTRYAGMIAQSENKELKQTLKQFRTACEQSQEELYQIAREKSYYVPAADFLVDAMSIMFVPATVGIMASVDTLKEMLFPICVITVVSTVLIMIVTGRVSQHIIRGQNNKGAAAMQTVGTEAAADDKEDR
jgi:hypothetical protein